MPKKKTNTKKTAAKSKPATKNKTAAKPKPGAKPKPVTAPKKAPPRAAVKAEADAKPDSPAPKPTKGKRRSKKSAAPKVPKTATAKADAKSAPKAKGHCASGKCTKGTCSMRKQLDGRSLYDRARECKDLDECRKFIGEFNEAIEQANQWLDDMHAQALSAEQARDMYGEQISDLLEAVDLDRARIAELEAELKKARSNSPEPATKAALAELAELSREVRAIRTDLKRLLDGRGPSTERRQQARAAEPRRRGRPRKDTATTDARSPASRSRAGERLITPRPVRAAARTARRGAGVPPGAFPKYSVLRGAACSLGVGKYGYPPEVCAPASFSRTEAAEIMGTYAQNKYGGLAKWALITGLPIDDVAIPLNAQAAAAPRATAAPKPRASSSSRRQAQPNARRGKAPKAGGESSNKQILDQVLLTVARV